MSFDLLNPWMLAGLVGVTLPVIAHLLSKKKYDIVNWGAMQFLKLGQETRRRVWLEDLWLLLLRMALIAWLAMAMARPWVSAPWLGDIGPQPNRDVVLILDGSYSMAWEGTSVTPQQQAIRWIDSFLDQLRPGDTVTLLEAREQVRTLIDPPTRDMHRVREALKQLPPPTGSANFPEALAHAIKLLSRTSHLRREVVVLTDGQAHGWFSDDTNLWLRVDDLKKQSSVTPHLWVVNVLDAAGNEDSAAPAERLNFHVERLRPSRELSVPGFPVRFQTRVRFSGGSTSVTRQVHFEVDGQRLAERTQTVTLAPGGEANVEFEHRFEATGSHLIRVALDADDLPTDNTSEAVIVVTDALPVLLVDGDPQANPVQSETFFVRAALSATGNDTPWVRPTIVKWSEWTPQFRAPAKPAAEAPAAPTTRPSIPVPNAARPQQEPAKEPAPFNDLDQYEAVVLANLPQLSDEQFAAVSDYVERGGGVGLVLGNRVQKDRYNTQLFAADSGWLGVQLDDIKIEPEEQREQGVFVANATLESPWLQRFRAERGAAFTTARFSRWWKVDLTEAKPPADEREPPRLDENSEPAQPKRPPAVVLARLQTGAPYLVSGQLGRGHVMLLTAPLDADWSTLPAKPDFVAFVHEWLFQLASGRGERNVAVGQPLIFPQASRSALKPHATPPEFVFVGPDGDLREAQHRGDGGSPLVCLEDTSLPGVYVLRPRQPEDDKRLAAQSAVEEKPAGPPPGQPVKLLGPGHELFVVNADRAESNLTPLNDEQIATITGEDRLQFIREGREIQAAASDELPRHELWQLLFLLFLGLLVGEVLLTRKLVRGGHVAADIERR